MGRLRAALRITCWWWLLAGTCWAQTAEAQLDLPIPVIDLRNHDWVAHPTAQLSGTWSFAWNQLDGRLAPPSNPDPSESRLLQVPGSWSEQGAAPTNHGLGTYRVRVLLSADHPSTMAIHLKEVLTAYEITVNGHFLGGMGRVGRDMETSRSEFGPSIFSLPQGDTLDIRLTCANFRHRQAGMAQPPVIGELDSIVQQRQLGTVMGGILIGLLLMSCAYLFMHYFQRRKDLPTFYVGLGSLLLAIHYLFLHERLLYWLTGPDLWNWTYKFELATLFWIQAIGLGLVYHLFQGTVPSKLRRILHWVMILESVVVLSLPIQLAAETDRLLPYHITLYLVGLVVVMTRALIRRIPAALPMALATTAVLFAALIDNFLFGVHVGGLRPIQYVLAAYMLIFGWLLSRRAAAAEHEIIQLSEDLEASNRALEEQNQSLETQVQERTEELVRMQQEAHELELEQVRRDIETLSANNQMKMQLTRNLVEELQQLLSAGGDYQSALKSLITGLRGQMATEERLEVLQDDLESVNAEFYRRLQAKYPQLSKTEREICAYLKLNLSGKDIAQLRKTSINTVNVARHRIRKKLGLERDEELEAIIQQL